MGNDRRKSLGGLTDNLVRDLVSDDRADVLGDGSGGVVGR